MVAERKLVTADDVVLGVLPLFHVFGLNAVFATLWIASALLFRHAAGPVVGANEPSSRIAAVLVWVGPRVVMGT